MPSMSDRKLEKHKMLRAMQRQQSLHGLRGEGSEVFLIKFQYICVHDLFWNSSRVFVPRQGDFHVEFFASGDKSAKGWRKRRVQEDVAS